MKITIKIQIQQNIRFANHNTLFCLLMTQPTPIWISNVGLCGSFSWAINQRKMFCWKVKQDPHLNKWAWIQLRIYILYTSFELEWAPMPNTIISCNMWFFYCWSICVNGVIQNVCMWTLNENDFRWWFCLCVGNPHAADYQKRFNCKYR